MLTFHKQGSQAVIEKFTPLKSQPHFPGYNELIFPEYDLTGMKSVLIIYHGHCPKQLFTVLKYSHEHKLG